MTISYNWLQEYLPVTIEPERLNKILTSIGLEVENFEAYESLKGGLKGLIVGEVIEKEKHPNADKLSVTKVDIGGSELLQIVCGAPNVEAGQKVVVIEDLVSTGAGNIKLEQTLCTTYHTYYERGQHILKESHWHLVKGNEDVGNGFHFQLSV